MANKKRNHSAQPREKKCLTKKRFIKNEKPMQKSVKVKKVKNTYKEWFIDRSIIIGQFLLKEAVKEIMKEAVKYLLSILIQ